MSLFGQKEPTQAKCPACEKSHDIIRPIENVRVIVCPLLPDLIYLQTVADREGRKLIRELIFGV